MKKKCNCGGLQAYAEGGRTRVPTRSTRFIDPEAESSRGRSALEAMRGYAGAPSQASVMYPGTQRGYEAGELAGMAEMLIPGASLAKGALGAALAGVIKPRGGNWIPGDVESSISNLLRREYGPESVQQQRDTLEFARRRGYDDEVIRELERAVQQREAPNVLNRWIGGPLTKYIKRDMATPEDPVRRLADEGILHMGIPQTVGVPSRGIQAARKLAGFPESGLSITPGGSLWENLSDRVVNSGPAKYLQEEPKMMAENPWMQKLDPETTVYSTPSHIERGLGFDHLVDELNNALNPESGLPRNLLLRPEQMQQMGMEKAVRHVDAINKWRAAQQAAANAELANKAMVIREYAENNPRGLRWMELGPEKEVDEALIQVGRDGGAKVELPGEEVRYFNSPEEAKKHIIERRLEKQLKYEGDTMGHCVGGYCPDVLEGKSRIFSLRDVKGEPHVTVEVNPAEEWVRRPGAVDENPIIKNEWPEFYRDLVRRVNGNPSPEDIATFKDYMLSKYPDDQSVASFFGPAFKIKQIKGKQNLAPKYEYLPFVQDFVRNNPLGGSWADVGDLINTGLRRVGDKYVTPEELKNLPKTADGFPIGYQPLDDLPEWRDGGLVAQPDYFDDLDAFLRR